MMEEERERAKIRRRKASRLKSKEKKALRKAQSEASDRAAKVVKAKRIRDEAEANLLEAIAVEEEML